MTAKILALGNQKGGAGKSTNAINIASSIAMTNSRVLLIDADEQGTCLDWAACSQKDLFPTVSMSNVKNPGKQIQQLAHDYDYIVIDTSPRLAHDLASILKVCDLVLVSCKPSPADIWGSDPLIENVKTMQELGSPILVRYLLCDVDFKSNYYKEILEAMSETGVETLKTIIASRKAYKQLDQGKSVIHTDDVKANSEVSLLTTEVLGILHETA